METYLLDQVCVCAAACNELLQVFDVLLLLLVLFHLDNLVLSHGLDVGVIVTLAGEGGERKVRMRQHDMRTRGDLTTGWYPMTAAIKELSSEYHPCST